MKMGDRKKQMIAVLAILGLLMIATVRYVLPRPVESVLGYKLEATSGSIQIYYNGEERSYPMDQEQLDALISLLSAQKITRLHTTATIEGKDETGFYGIALTREGERASQRLIRVDRNGNIYVAHGRYELRDEASREKLVEMLSSIVPLPGVS